MRANTMPLTLFGYQFFICHILYTQKTERLIICSKLTCLNLSSGEQSFLKILIVLHIISSFFSSGALLVKKQVNIMSFAQTEERQWNGFHLMSIHILFIKFNSSSFY